MQEPDNDQGQNLPAVSDPSRADLDNIWRHLPAIIAELGRSKGFQAARDLAFYHWNSLRANMPGYSALKLAIEFDRHAMFAEVASERAKGRYDENLWRGFQSYLHGEVEVAPASGYTKQPPTPKDMDNGDFVDVKEGEDGSEQEDSETLQQGPTTEGESGPIPRSD